MIAFDSLGRKFTNCTAVNPSFEVKGEGQIRLKNEVYRQSEWAK